MTNLTENKFNIFNFTVHATGGHVKGVKDILYFGKEFGETYIGGDESVSDIIPSSPELINFITKAESLA